MILSLLILLPLLGFFLNGFYHLVCARSGRKASFKVSGWLASLLMICTFLLTCCYAWLLFSLPPDGRLFEQSLFSWMHLGKLSIDFALRFDSLSVVFCLVITGVGSLIHLYSVGYMAEDANPAKYFAYLNLFCFMMLNLVLGTTLPHVFLGWEGVGLASYLLIGFWNNDFEKVIAGQKAFIMNRIGDLAFLIAMFIAFKHQNTLDPLKLTAAGFSPEVLTAFGLLIFFACTGKSAQIPLFTWLPDAMAGPTPVSALIHAATMVTSGIYLLTRLAPVISVSSDVMWIIAMVGGTTAFLAALMASAQTDIKKVLAYSTISQLGFMFLACGVGAFDAGVFHVMTHAFFKALLFLGAGSVIHALHGEQNIFKMGGLLKKIPITGWTFIVGWAAILGLPPFSGFFSKDEIIYRSLVSPHGGKTLFALAVVSAFLTAFYMTRLVVLVFLGPSKVDAKVEKKIHESPLSMVVPLVALAVAALAGGWFGSPTHLEGLVEGHTSTELIVMVLSVALALLGAGIGYRRYHSIKGEEVVQKFLQSGMGLDAFYVKVVGRGLLRSAQGVYSLIEEMIVQRLMRWTTAVIDLSGNLLKVSQVGSSQVYLMTIVFAIFAILAWVLFGVGQYGKL